MSSVNANLLTINQAKSRINQAKKEGKEIRLGDLGVFSVLLTSKGAEDADKFTAQNITDVKVQWKPCQRGLFLCVGFYLLNIFHQRILAVQQIVVHSYHVVDVSIALHLDMKSLAIYKRVAA